MDAFAVSICTGLGMTKIKLKKALTVGLYFGVFQAGMPLIGYLAASTFAHMVEMISHWIALVLLTFLGIKSIIDSIKKDKETTKNNNETCELTLGPAKMLPLAVATSIDALAVGVSLAFLRVNIVPAVLLIGLTTFTISTVGVFIGNTLGMKFKRKAQLAGGIILILIGIYIVLENYGIVSF